jgi:hypothetical protein
MKRYEFSDWELIFGSPVKRTYGRGRTMLGRWLGPFWWRVSVEWDGTRRISAQRWHLWPARQSWSMDELAGVSFGIREEIERRPNCVPVHRGWYWYVHLTARQQGGAGRGRVLAEFVVGHQHDRPATDIGRASVPPRVQDLVTWLEACTQYHAHGPVLVPDKGQQERVTITAKRRTRKRPEGE